MRREFGVKIKTKMTDIATNFFKQLFKSQGMQDNSEILKAVKTTVTEEMNSNLTKEFTKKEIGSAVKHMHPTKAPGPDGMPALFFQKF